jgi:hypothetical protein
VSGKPEEVQHATGIIASIIDTVDQARQVRYPLMHLVQSCATSWQMRCPLICLVQSCATSWECFYCRDSLQYSYSVGIKLTPLLLVILYHTCCMMPCISFTSLKRCCLAPQIMLDNKPAPFSHILKAFHHESASLKASVCSKYMLML